MQDSLFKKTALYHGGEYSLGKAKIRRPLSSKHSHHIVLRVTSEVSSLLVKERRHFITSQIKKWSKHFGVRIYAQSINSTHIHLLIHSKHLPSLRNFLRVLPGQIAQQLGKGVSQFWMHLIFSRVVMWGKAFTIAMKYIEKNTLEAAGLLTYKRNRSLKSALNTS